MVTYGLLGIGVTQSPRNIGRSEHRFAVFVRGYSDLPELIVLEDLNTVHAYFCLYIFISMRRYLNIFRSEAGFEPAWMLSEERPPATVLPRPLSALLFKCVCHFRHSLAVIILS